MIGIVGTVPDPEFALLHGPARLADGALWVKGRRIAVNRGTPALVAAALRAAERYPSQEIYVFLVGDIGKGEGSRRLYAFLSEHLSGFTFRVLTFHYLQPDVDWHNRVLFAVEAMVRRPLLIADAGFMYAAKMSGQADRYDFFTPDMGELAFLADESAPHPFYTRGFILHEENLAPDLIHRAYKHRNAAAHLVVKGKTDYIVRHGEVVETVSRPAFETMEAIGGTGDTLTGILTVLCGAGYDPVDAGVLSARANRWVGFHTRPTPATQVAELIDTISRALADVLDGRGRAPADGG